MADLQTARWLITAATVAYGFGPFVVDMNRTHLLHPAWPGHARLHLFWSAVSQACVAAVALWLVWGKTPDPHWSVRLAGVIGLGFNAGFWVALLARRWFRGTLHDPQGIPPIGGKVDGNLLAVGLITALLVAGLFAAH